MDDDNNESAEQEGNETETETSGRRSQPIAATVGRGGAIQGSPSLKYTGGATLLKQHYSLTCPNHAALRTHGPA